MKQYGHVEPPPTFPKGYAYYKVKAYNSGGESPYSNILSFTVDLEPLW